MWSRMYRMAEKIDEMLLIDKVREHECLYNIISKHYRDQNMRREAWDEIALEMGTTGDTVKTAWNKLRNCFFNAQRRRKTKSGQLSTKIVKWKYEKEMEFLLPYLELRQMHTNLAEHPIEELNDGDDDGDHETVESQEEPELLTVNINPYSATSSDSSLKKHIPRRSQTSNPAQEMVKLMKENAELREYQNITKSLQDQSTLDEIDMFYLSMGKIVKRLPPIEQATIRMKLCNMISEAEIRQMQTPIQF